MTTPRERYLATLRESVDAWHAGEIDFATFTAFQRDTWEEIRQTGPDIEYEVLRALRDQLPTAFPGTGARWECPRICRAQIRCPKRTQDL